MIGNPDYWIIQLDSRRMYIKLPAKMVFYGYLYNFLYSSAINICLIDFFVGSW